MAGLLTGFKSFDKATGGLEYKKNYLLLGNKESGKEPFLYKLLGNVLSSKLAVTYILTNKSSTEFVTELTARGINISRFLGDSFKIIDNFSRTISPSAADNSYTKVVNGPLDLTSLSVAISGVNDDFIKDGRQVLNIFDSISSLLIYNNISTVFRFMQFVCGRSKMSGVTTLFAINEEMHPPEVTETVKSLVDGIIRLKLENTKRKFTLSGTEKEVLEWSDLE